MAHPANDSGEATTPPGHEDSKNTNTPLPWIRIVFLAFLCWLSFGSLPFISYHFIIRDEPLIEQLLPHTGQIGDTFGAANAAFSAFALVFLAIALVQQQRAIANQLADLELTRKELILTRKTSQGMEKIQKIIPLFSERYSKELREAQNHLEVLLARDAAKKHEECLVTPGLQNEDFNFYGSITQGIYLELKYKQAMGTLCARDQEYVIKLDTDIQIFYAFVYKISLLFRGEIIDEEDAKILIDPHTAEIILDIVIPLELSRTAQHTSPVYDFINSLYSREEIKESSMRSELRMDAAPAATN